MNFANLIGHFHPLLVHLPIGILILGIVVAIASRFERWHNLQSFLPFILFWGALSAIASCITGYVLSWSGDYNADLLEKHQWTGIALAVVSTGAYALDRFYKKQNNLISTLSWLSIGGLLLVVGHYGGSLTHGKGYLTEGVFEKPKTAKTVEKTTDSLQNSQINALLMPSVSTNDTGKMMNIAVPKALDNIDKYNIPQPISPSNNSLGQAPTAVENPVFIYKDLIQPILEQRCYSCHGPNKSKADLRLDSPEAIRQGGESGSILVVGNAEKSTLYSYLILPLEDDDHMPPEGKPQLTEQQIQLIRFWIEKGASFDKSVQELAGGSKKNIPPSVSAASKPVLSSAEVPKTTLPITNPSTNYNQNDSKNGSRTEKVIVQGALPEVKRVDIEAAILQQTVTAPNPVDLQRLTKQLIQVSNFGEKSNYVMANFVNVKNYNSSLIDDLQSIQNQLIRLKLSNLPITNNDLLKISKLKNITRLNLEKTAITDEGLVHLKNLPNLEQLNIYGTSVTDKGLEALMSCKNLKTLYLWETKTTEKGIENFNKMMQNKVKIEMGGVKFHKPDTLKK
jgi:uncharacterized membrane protein